MAINKEMNTLNQDNTNRVQEIRDIGDFQKLRMLWDDLAKKQGAYTPFLCFDWFKLWLDHFLKDNRLLILLLYKGSEIIAIAPFLLLRERFKLITAKKIELIGNVYSPVRNFIFNDLSIEEKKICFSKIFDYLFYDLGDWDVIDLKPFLGDDENLIILHNIIQEKDYQNCKEVYDENWYMNGINHSSDEYFKNKQSSKHMISMIKRRKKLEELGKLEYKVIKSDEDIERYMDYYYEVYGRSWKKKGGIGPTFHRDLGRFAGEKGWLRLGFLFLNHFPIATQFCIVSNKTGYFLKVAYDEKYKEYGVGNIIHYESIKYMIDHDSIESIDLGAGSEDYKKFWVSDKRQMMRVILFNDSFKGILLALFNNRILPTVNKYKSMRKIKEIFSNRLR